VAAAIQYARIQSPAEIYITSKDVDRWYGAINQARLALQAQYHLDALESFDDAPEIVLQAYFRDRFYVFLLGMFLEHVMR
jgi:hypothetical protein